MGSITLSGNNVRLSYNLKGSHIAKLRARDLATSYGVVSEESHAKRMRAFYPHLRVQGQFALTFDFIHWREYDTCMRWFRTYIEAVIDARDPSPMLVQMGARSFVRLGIPLSGMTFGDHVGSMVFSPTITFISVSDPRDPKTSILDAAQASHSTLPAGNQTASKWFYPDSQLNHPGKLQQYIYDQQQATAAQQAASVQDTINGGADSGTAGTGQQRPI